MNVDNSNNIVGFHKPDFRIVANSNNALNNKDI